MLIAAELPFPICCCAEFAVCLLSGEELLQEIKKKFGQPRRTQLISQGDIREFDEEEYVEDYGVRVVLTREGYFKKVTFASLRGNDEHKLKEGDEILIEFDTTNTAELIFFSDKAQVYKAKVTSFGAVKARRSDYCPEARA